MRVAVYSGSFDPLHIGHLQILRSLQADDRFGAVYLIVSPRSPFKGAAKARNARKRYEAAVEAVKRHTELTKVTVDDIELTMPEPQYTYKTLDALKAREQGNDFTLVVGADNLAVFSGWREYGRILLEYGLMVFPRGEVDREALKSELLEENPAYRIELADMPLVDVSSTEIRESANAAEGLLM
ncbi:MAG: nicotinate (nicotinamide) nucleotide adenylyltransferase [Bacteroidales bacterium]|nr:nicotinate (nicotinamide) nucleotide adenylyltransferase [Bacteroidales bacterium]